MVDDERECAIRHDLRTAQGILLFLRLNGANRLNRIGEAAVGKHLRFQRSGEALIRCKGQRCRLDPQRANLMPGEQLVELFCQVSLQNNFAVLNGLFCDFNITEIDDKIALLTGDKQRARRRRKAREIEPIRI